MIVGIGVNVEQSPSKGEMLYPATSLKAAGITTAADDFLACYLRILAQSIEENAADLRQEWLQNAKGIGQKIVIRQSGAEQTGIFEGIDENADLILRIGNKKQRILVGDVFYLGEENG